MNKTTEDIWNEEQRFREERILHDYRRAKAVNPFEAAILARDNADAISRAMEREKASQNDGPDAA